MKKSVFVTGAAYGTGFAIAKKFAMEGYNVFFSGRDGEKIDVAAKKLSEEYGIYAKGYVTTLFNQEEVTTIFKDIRNNGYLLDSITIGTFVDTQENALKWKKLGVKYISYSVDMGIFYDAMMKIVNTVTNVEYQK